MKCSKHLPTHITMMFCSFFRMDRPRLRAGAGLGLLAFLLLLGPLRAFAQTFPFQVTTQVSPPHSVLLSDYVSPESEKLVANVLFRDFNEPSYEFKLKITIQSNNVLLETRPEFIPPQPFTIFPGEPMRLTGADLAPYFAPNALNVAGISRAALSGNGKLPDGLYSFCFQVLDYRTGKPLSAQSCQTAWLMSIDEPQIIGPLCGTALPVQDPQNIFFQWQLNNAMFPSAFASIEYVLRLFEVTDPATNPLMAVANSRALKIFESEPVRQSSFLYDMTAPPLEPGKVYVFQVQAIDTEGRDLIKNNGNSQYCWFSYGYPTGGRLRIEAPLARHVFGKEEQKVLKWSAPDKTKQGQQVAYRLNIVKMEEGQTPEVAIEQNMPWLEERTPSVFATGSWEQLLRQSLEPGVQYAWQVTAYSGEQQVASSPVSTFSGPSAIEKFKAGPHEILVIYVGTADQSEGRMNLSGKGKMQIGKDGEELEFEFREAALRQIAGLWVLDKGEILIPASNRPVIELAPVIAENGPAFFYPHQYRLDSRQLLYEGSVRWPMPHAVLSGRADSVRFVRTGFNFDRYELVGTSRADEGNQFRLLEPLNYLLNLNTSTDVVVKDGNRIEFRFSGELVCSDVVKGLGGSSSEPVALSVRLMQAPRLDYLTLDAADFPIPVRALTGTQIQLQPLRFIMDLSEASSPGVFSAEPAWKGIYFERYQFRLPAWFDYSTQLTLGAPFSADLQTTSASSGAWLTARGLSWNHEQTWASGKPASFNTFPGQLEAFLIRMEDNAVSEGHFKGAIFIPLLAGEEPLTYTLPLSQAGPGVGALDESLAGRFFSFNPNGGDQRVDMQIARAVFAENQRLDIALDVSWNSIDLNIPALQPFNVWGNGAIGFGIPNGQIPLEKQAKGELASGNTIFVTHVFAGRRGGEYVFGVRAEVVMMPGMTGTDGPPAVELMSMQDFSAALTAVESAGRSATPPTSEPIPGPIAGKYEVKKREAGITNIYNASVPASILNTSKNQLINQEGRITMDSMYVKIGVPMVISVEGMMKLYYGHEVYGDAWMGALDGQLSLPLALKAYALVIAGAKKNSLLGTQIAYNAPFTLIQVGVALGGKMESTAAQRELYDRVRTEFNADVEREIDVENEEGVELTDEDIETLVKAELDELMRKAVKTDDELLLLFRSGYKDKLKDHEKRRLDFIIARLQDTNDDFSGNMETKEKYTALFFMKQGLKITDYLTGGDLTKLKQQAIELGKSVKDFGGSAVTKVKLVGGKVVSYFSSGKPAVTDPNSFKGKAKAFLSAKWKAASAGFASIKNKISPPATPGVKKEGMMQKLAKVQKGIPIIPKVLFLTGGEAVIYFGMKRATFEDIGEDIDMHRLTFVPEPLMNGYMFRMQFADMPTGGMIAQFGTLREEATGARQSQYGIPLPGNTFAMKVFGKVGNLQMFGINYSTADIDGKIVLSVPDLRFKGEVNAMYNAPIICGQVNAVLDISPKAFTCGMGSWERPVYSTPKCLGVSTLSYGQITERDIAFGFGIKIGVDMQLPWLGVRGVLAFRPYVVAYAQVLAGTRIVTQPELGIDNARVKAEVRAAVGMDYEVAVVGSGNLNLVDVMLRGDLITTFGDKENAIEGRFKGQVRVIGENVNIETPTWRQTF